MKTIVSLCALSACSVSAFAFASECFDTALTTVQMRQCAAAEFQAADAELNAVWPKVVAHFKAIDAEVSSSLGSTAIVPERAAAALIVEAQRAWITLRDNDALAASASNAGGSIQPLVVLSIKSERTRERIATLRRFLNDETLGDVTGAGAVGYFELTKETEECQGGSSTVEWKACVGAVSEKADADLNAFYRVAKSALGRIPGAAAQLTTAQRAWITMRDADCAAATRISWGGTGQSGFEATCHALTTIERTQQIRGTFPNK